MRKYDHSKIEKKWRETWDKAKLYSTPDTTGGKENYYLLVEFPYPSGNLHVGHWYAFAVPDILARYMRMKGQNVMYPIGFDAFGLPAENAAIKNKINPRAWTEQNIAYMREQIKSMGTSFDLSREVSTIDPAYYKWTQWLFLQLFKAGLAYRKETAVNWCPKDKTVLANEQVVDGKCERCDSVVEQRQMLQWNIKITEYADRLIDDLAALDWPEQIKEAQRNWIGRSEGAEIDFPLVFDDNKKYKYVILHGFEGSPDSPRWQWIKAELEKLGHTVIIPALPHPEAPREEEQVEAALTAADYDENTVLVGHSLGGVVAMKVLEKLKKPIGRLVLIGTAPNPNFKDHSRNFEKTFSWSFDSAKIRGNAKTIQILHDPRDHAVSEDQRKQLEELLGVKAFFGESNKPHFTGDKEPDVLMWLRPTIRVFTTRADTLFGATYLVLAPEHPWISLALKHEGLLKNEDDIYRYIDTSRNKSDLQRQENKEKTGVRLEGVEAINPANGEKIQLFVADYVLGHYGTGAIMAVPAHDERDFEFAQKFNLQIRQVVAPLVRSEAPRKDAVRSEPFRGRDAVMCIVKHWEKDEYLCLEWKQHPDVRAFISGGVEDGEDSIEAGKREILEESGFRNATFIRSLGTSIIEFYHQAKKHNVSAAMQYLYFELQDGEQGQISPEEDARHTLLWKTRAEVLDFITLVEKDEVWRRFLVGDEPYVGDGLLINSGKFNRLSTQEANQKITNEVGQIKKTYRLRDWIVSRQRYWGVPIPIVRCEKCGDVAVPDKELPVLLPDVEDYLPTGDGKSPLAKVKSFVQTKCPQCGGEGKRETDTFDTFVDSSWYFLRYADPKNSEEFADGSKQKNWMPIDLYSGGAEHTTMHLLYSRFWHKALFDLGLVADSEPYTRRMNHGVILGPDHQKMSKSRGNVIDPDALVERLGADTVRLYLAFIGPYNEVGSYPWNADGVVGVRRFLERIWRVADLRRPDADNAELETPLHQTIKKVGEDIEALKFNTAIAQLMIFLNAVERQGSIGEGQWKTLLRLVAPFAPHIAEELWQLSGGNGSIHLEEWPTYNSALLQSEEVTVAVQIDGKTRGTIRVARDTSKEEIEKAALAAVEGRLAGKNIVRVVVVPNRLFNFVLQRE